MSSTQPNAGFPIVRHNQTVLPTQQHQCTGTNTDQPSIMAVPQKKKPKKKKKKKKDEEPKLDLANIMKLSGKFLYCMKVSYFIILKNYKIIIGMTLSELNFNLCKFLLLN